MLCKYSTRMLRFQRMIFTGLFFDAEQVYMHLLIFKPSRYIRKDFNEIDCSDGGGCSLGS